MNTEIEVNSSTTEAENEVSPLQPRRSSRAPSESLYRVESPNAQILDSFDSKDYDSYKAFLLSTDAVNYNEDLHQDDNTPVVRRLHRKVSWIRAPCYQSHSSWLAKPRIQLGSQHRDQSRDKCIKSALQALDANDWNNMEEFLNPWGWQQVTLVHLAAYRGNIDMLSHAIRLCAHNKSTLFAVVDNDKNMGPLLTKDKLGRIALHYAASEGHSNVVSWILEQDGPRSPTYLQLSSEDVFSRTPLHDAAEGLHVDVVKLLVDAGAAVNVPNKKGVPPYLPTKTDLVTDNANKLSRYENIVDIFVTAGAHVNFCHPETGWTMLHHAVLQGSKRTSKLLLDYGADPGRRSMELKAVTPAHIATGSGNHQVLRILLQYLPPSSIDVPNGDGLSPLQIAASKGDLECVRALVDKGGNLARTYPNSNRTVINDLLVMVDKRDIVTFFVSLLDTKIYSSRVVQDSAVLDYQVLLPEGERQMAVVSVLTNAMKLTELQTILRHPLLQTYIEKKWSHFSKVFYSFLIIYTLFIVSLSTYTIAYLEHYRHQHIRELSSGHNTWSKWSMLFSACILFCHNLIQFLKNPRWYLRHYEDCLSFVPLVISIVVLVNDRFEGDVRKSWVVQALSVAFPSAGIHLILFYGRFSAWGHYAHLLSTVLKHVLKMLLFGLVIIAGLSLSFHILYSNVYRFHTPMKAFWTILTMMTEQYEYIILLDESPANDTANDSSINTANYTANNISINTANYIANDSTLSESPDEQKIIETSFVTKAVLFTFGISTSTALMSLIVGVAVSDVQKLKTQGKISRLLKQAEFITHSEWMKTNLIFTNAWVPNCLRKWVASTDIAVHQIIPRNKRRPRYVSKKVWREIFTLCKENEQRDQERRMKESRVHDRDGSFLALQSAITAIQSAQKSIISELQLQSSRIQQLTQSRNADMQIEVLGRSKESEC